MHFHDLQHRLAVLHKAFKRADLLATRYDCVCYAGTTAVTAIPMTFVAIGYQAHRHDERAEIGEAEVERGGTNGCSARDLLRGIARVIDEDLLGGDENLHGRLEALDIEHPVRAATNRIRFSDARLQALSCRGT